MKNTKQIEQIEYVQPSLKVFKLEVRKVVCISTEPEAESGEAYTGEEWQQ